MEILILGGGIAGISTAYQLLKDGHKVTVIDRHHPGMGGASFGNAGLIAVGHSIAWGSPRALKIWLETLFHDHPVFKMNLRLDPQLIRWGLRFITQCTNSRAVQNTKDKHRISVYSQKILNQVVAETGVKYEKNSKGLLFLYRNKHAFEEGIKHTLLLKDAGQRLETADKDRVQELIPELKNSTDQIAGGIFSPGDESGDSRLFCEKLMENCREMGGVFIQDVTIERLEASRDLIKRVITNKGVYTAERYVLCLGSWSPLLVRSSLGISLPIYPVKGYSITVPVENHHTPPRIGGLHEEDFLGFAPMGDHFRVSSVSEFSGYDVGHTPEDFEHIFKCAKKLFPKCP